MNRSFTYGVLSSLALAVAGLALALAVARLWSVISFAEPLHLVTSGDEQASLFAIWKVINGQTVYADRFQAPFALYSYNWLFIRVYSLVAAGVQAALGLGDAWIPTIARLITLSGIAWAGAAAYRSFVDALPDDDRHGRRLSLAVAVLFAFGPLIGFWAATARPDLWALALEVSGALLFLRLYPKNRGGALAAVIVCAYGAWAFKQTAVLFVGAVGLFLCVRREWRMVLALAAIIIAAWGATFALGSADYAAAVLFRDVPLSYDLGRGLRNVANFAVKAMPLVTGAGALAAIVLTSPSLRRTASDDDRLLFAATGVVLAAALALPASTQTGASENYYFTLSYFLSLALIAGIGLLRRQGIVPDKSFFAAAGGGWAVVAVALMTVFAGVTGRIDIRDQHATYLTAKACLDRMPRPLFVDDRYLSLPWMTPGNEPFVLSDLYEEDRALNRPFDGDGIGGRIRDRRFAALAFSGASKPASFDGAALDGYREAPYSCPPWVVLLRD